jgi:hypothetical protein
MNALWVSNTLAGKVTYRAFCEPRSLRRLLPLPPRAARSASVIQLRSLREADVAQLICEMFGDVPTAALHIGSTNKLAAIRSSAPSSHTRPRARGAV